MYRQEIKLVIESKLLNIEILTNAVRGICNTLVKDEILSYQLVLCLVEAITNVIIHAYHREPNHLVEVNVIVDQDSVTFEVMDTGEKGALPDLQKKIQESSDEVLTLQESGRGLFLINSLMDQVSYNQSEDGKNLFKMMKKLRNQMEV